MEQERCAARFPCRLSGRDGEEEPSVGFGNWVWGLARWVEQPVAAVPRMVTVQPEVRGSM